MVAGLIFIQITPPIISIIWREGLNKYNKVLSYYLRSRFNLYLLFSFNNHLVKRRKIVTLCLWYLNINKSDNVWLIPYQIMKLKKRKIKYSTIFFVCWFALSYILIDVVLKFQTLLDIFGSFALLETILWLWVLLPTLAVYIFTKDE